MILFCIVRISSCCCFVRPAEMASLTAIPVFTKPLTLLTMLGRYLSVCVHQEPPRFTMAPPLSSKVMYFFIRWVDTYFLNSGSSRSFNRKRRTSGGIFLPFLILCLRNRVTLRTASFLVASSSSLSSSYSSTSSSSSSLSPKKAFFAFLMTSIIPDPLSFASSF